MRYAISYVSTARVGLKEQEINDIMAKTNKHNTAEKITGILLYNEINFFQLLEGEKETIQNLYEKIKQDPRHKDIIKILEKPVSKSPFDGYLTDFVTDTNKYDGSQLKHYLHYIEVLDPHSQKGVKRIIELIMA